ncbi:unnamed protein product, partial [Choristocarpus tenellus]
MLQCLQDKMHPKGTIALTVPHPWKVHLHRINEALTASKVGLSLEDHPLMLGYKTRRGGRPRLGTDNHLKSHLDMICLAHNDATMFTCNKQATINDIF